MTEHTGDAVGRYLTCMAAHDWDGLADTITDSGLTREGPFCDRVEGKQNYVTFLRKIITSLKGYELKVQRVSHVSDRVSYVELTESFEIDGARTKYPECILFERGDDGLITHVSVFIKRPGADAPVPGGKAT
ncbi:hypothetical protein MSP7336_03033 [Mycobacterium shimoidei]|uniref:SnoaL-like domain-containing protein n=1 Tax=Mycobacterium shimoidei TaxID=29313 RepID=A0A375Z118_MYCSH|nr:nuclear transport factor 2 family protein [Mycobacterium shimoidei]SRX94772.1 hypothetical protein MSP7336_03033 [Mycobacterium shimoidei]